MFHPAVSNMGITIPSGTKLQALAMEVVVSFVLMFVTLAVATYLCNTRQVNVIYSHLNYADRRACRDGAWLHGYG